MSRIMAASITGRSPSSWMAVLMAGLLIGCAPRVYLMPTPVVFQTGEIDPYAKLRDKEQTTSVRIFYATNRPAVGLAKNRKYINGTTEELRMGEATIRIGGGDDLWEKLYQISTGGEREGSIPLYLDSASEMALLGPEDSLENPPREALEFAQAINRALADTIYKEVTIYVHGANCSFYRGTAQAAQYQHFTGRNGVMVAFAWPSEASLLRYSTDVLHAAASAPLFARFVEFLATHTDAQYVNILAYSAGAQVASPGLAILRETHRDTDVGQVKERLRIAEAYFAAPDVEFRRFATHDLPAFMPLVGRATMTLFLDDAVLGISEWHHGTSRAGSPNLDELGPEETEWLLDAAITPDFDVIDMGLAGAPALTDSHGYWYNNPWVSSDVLFQFIYHVGPGLRGLVPLSVEDPVWYFPEDYPETVFEALRRIREASGEIAPAP